MINNDSDKKYSNTTANNKGIDKAVIVQTGCGCCHGRDPTKAAIRACRDAIEYNSVKIRTIIPGGYDAMKIHVQIGVPITTEEQVDLNAIAQVFPYGELLPIVVESGGLLGSNTASLPGTGEAKEDMTIAVACVTIGYNE